MFAEFAPKMREKGWQSPIPLRPGLKRPAIYRWQIFSKRQPTEAELTKWARIYWNYGVGLPFGLDNVIGVDLDWLDPAIAARAEDITKEILGETPLHRVGRPPKRLALYRYDPHLVIGRAYGGFELFTKSGQCVIFGIHPDTKQPYRWLGDTPATIGPAELTFVERDQIVALIDALARLDPDGTNRHRAKTRGLAQPGIATEILQALADVTDAPPVVAKILAAARRGKRHNTMVGAVMALAMRGFSDRSIFNALDTPYSNLMDDELSWEQADEELANAIRWARERHGADDEAIARDLGSALRNIAATWNRRWGRS